jgi:hypothetical protein
MNDFSKKINVAELSIGMEILVVEFNNHPAQQEVLQPDLLYFKKNFAKVFSDKIKNIHINDTAATVELEKTGEHWIAKIAASEPNFVFSP